jgi:hypothetical protein
MFLPSSSTDNWIVENGDRRQQIDAAVALPLFEEERARPRRPGQAYLPVFTATFS